MASSLWKSLVEAMNLEHPAKGASGLREHKLERKPQPQMVWDESNVVSISALEHRGVRGDPDVAQTCNEVPVQQVPMGEFSLEGSHELWDSGEELPSGELTAQMAVNRTIPVLIPESSHVIGPTSFVSHMQHDGEDFNALGHSNLLKDAKFYQDTTVKYQSTFYSIQDKYFEQVHLLEEVSGALWATESKASQMQQELLALRGNRDADIQQAVGRVVSQYQAQLNTTQSCTREHQVVIQQLCKQVKSLELSLAGQTDLPSVGQTQGEVDLWEEVLNILPGTVNTTCGASVYN